MTDPVLQAMHFLADPSRHVTESDKASLMNIANVILTSDLTPDARNGAISTLERGMATKDKYKAIFIESMLLCLTKRPKHSARIAQHLQSYKPDIEEANSTYTNLVWQRFTMDETKDKRLYQHCTRAATLPLFRHLISLFKGMYDREVPDHPTTFKRTNRVVVVTRQMQMPPHAPSVRTLEFAHNLIEKHGKEVMIVCSSELSKSYNGAIMPSAHGNYDERFFNLKTITYEGIQIPFTICGNGVFSEASLREGIRAIHDFGPDMILSIGSPNLLPEVFHQRCFCFFYNSGRGLPLTQHQHFHMWEDPTPEQAKQIKQEKLAENFLFVSTPGYHVQKQFMTLNRSDYNLPEDSFVFAVIGMRLTTEVDSSFIEMMATIQKSTNCYFIFAGRFEGFNTAFASHPALGENCRYLDMQPDIMAVYALANAYLNPERKGGGSSAAQALQAGIPVLTLPSGDVGFMATNFPKLPNYNTVGHVAIELATNPEKMVEYKAYTAAEAKRLSVRDAYLERILEEFEKYAAQKEQEQSLN
ncbi:glycosyltransferase family protein [Kordiimonas pumila]|uniref:Glycosyl transferase family 1 domain-containing protein n=1 Tax=Kordiimonas pumila TaxID=2161677 RepID=A0ABV7D134_9PROT|nr:hypothetical protein [Kordiimonas pumila]